jgi:hypothetical protein
VGYHAETQRLLVGVWGVWEGYLVGVHATEPLAVLRRAPGLARQNRHDAQGTIGTPWASLRRKKLFPESFAPTGHGDYFGGRWVYDADLEDGPMVGGNYYAGPPVHALMGAWGDTLVDSVSGDELVRVEQRVEPGDVLAAGGVAGEDVYGRVYGGAMLYRIGARGGFAPLWDAPLEGLTVSGMDVSPSGRLCLADAVHGRIVERTPVEEDLIPTATTLDADAPGVADCFYEDDDSLLLLVADPPRVERWRRGAADTELVEALSGRPAMFVREAGGGYSLLDADGPVRGAVVLADGTRFEVVDGDGSPIPMAGVQGVGYFDYGERFELVERPDGLIVTLGVEAAYPYTRTSVGLDRVHPGFYDRGRDEAVPIAVFEELTGTNGWTALARVPGGIGRDPWTDEPVGPEGWVGGDDGGPGVTTTPLGPGRQGTPTGGAQIASGDDGGCHGAPGGAGGWLLALLVAWFATRRPGARRRRAAGDRSKERVVIE